MSKLAEIGQSLFGKEIQRSNRLIRVCENKNKSFIVMSYESDLREEEWKILEPFFPTYREYCRPRVHRIRSIINGIHYVIRTAQPVALTISRRTAQPVVANKTISAVIVAGSL